MSLLVSLAPLGPPLLVGLLGGVHCASMCGGIAAAIGMRARRDVSRPAPVPVVLHPGKRAVRVLSPAAVGDVVPMSASATGADPAIGSTGPQGAAAARMAGSAGAGVLVSRLLAYNAGRIGTYGILGALAGAAGSAAWLMNGVLPVQQAAFAFASLMLLAFGAYLLGERRTSRWLESLGGPVWRRLQPLAARSLAPRAPLSGLRLALTGGLWGLVPCAMVYGVLLTALASGSALQGAALMLAFGLGTLPNLMALGWSAGWLTRLRALPAARVAAALLLITFGALGIARVLGAPLGPLGDLLCFVPAPQ